jgi:serine/threonine-protein kinase
MQTEPAPPPVRQGEMLAGKYLVDRIIGEGGMGVVVLATNVALQQKVAVKLLRASAVAHVEARGRFEREARAAANLKSHHVAKALDVGELPDGRPYMVMEYLEGQDLGDLIDKGPPLSTQEAVDFVLQACEAIAEAHAARIVHRDLKPRNLFLTSSVDGRPLVKVLDFGISKIEGSPQDMQLTRTTEVIGSPSYMSPEQLRASRDVDSRTDIWALGVILYELLTKRLPFYGNTVTELVAVVLMEPYPSIRSMRPDVPQAIEDAVARCLAKRPADRVQTVVELAQLLEPFSSGGSASLADRVRGVAFQSGNLPSGMIPPAASSGRLPPGGSSSARINVHAGTSVAWGETQIDPPKGAPPQAASKAPLVLAAAALLVAVGGAAVGGTLWYTKRAHATESGPQATPPPSAQPVPLPPGRKDLPPLTPPAAPSGGTGSPAEIASGLPDSRMPSPGETAPAKPPATSPTSPTSTGATPRVRPGHAGRSPGRPSTAPTSDDPLSNIGRR